ncbi:dihydropteroate synthase [Saccharicrinis carchari]|nr:dihydropteroate synthase [Saccharicrinis carchari]
MKTALNYLKIPTIMNCNGKLIDLSKPRVMGILNITPDSFYDGGKYNTGTTILNRVRQMHAEGADIIDIGAYSSRPGAQHITAEKEWDRLAEVLELLRKEKPDMLISVDTFRAEIAKRAVQEYEVDIINDISAGEMDRQMFATMAELNVPYIIMHMKGTPQSMQQNPVYKKDVVFEVMDFLAEKKRQLSLMGVHDVIIDPGFGFGKTLEHNYALMNRLNQLKILELPMLVGVSRKSMIYKLLGGSPQEALNGTTALNMMALQQGANILRVHDVKEAGECVRIFNAVSVL